MPQLAASTAISTPSPPSHSPTCSPLSLFERRGLPAIKLTIPNTLKGNSGLQSHSSSMGGCFVASGQNDSDNTSLSQNSTVLASASTRRDSITSLNSAKYSINSLLEDANPADEKTLTQLFALMDRLQMDIQLDLSGGC